VREVLLLMLPRTLGLAFVQINFVVNIALASGMVEGSSTALVTAWLLLFFTLGVIAQSLGTVLLPQLSGLAAASDLDGYARALERGMRSVLFLALPATAALLVFAAPLIQAVFEYGAWTHPQTLATAWALQWFAIGIVGHSLLEVLARAFYALSDTWTPVRFGIASVVVNIALSLALVRVLGDPTALANGPFGGVALANSLATLAEAVVLLALLRRRVPPLRLAALLPMLARTTAASLALALVGGLLLAALPALPAPLRAFAALAGAGLAFAGVALLLGVEEMRVVPRLLLRRAGR
jgi:putative peptidoglycan lipid II flippase